RRGRWGGLPIRRAGRAGSVPRGRRADRGGTMTERTSGRARSLRPAHRLAAAALALGALAPLAACGGSGPDEPPPAPDDVPAYEVARQDVLAAVQQVVGADGWAQEDD